MPATYTVTVDVETEKKDLPDGSPVFIGMYFRLGVKKFLCKSPPYRCVFSDMPPGIYDLTIHAVDEKQGTIGTPITGKIDVGQPGKFPATTGVKVTTTPAQ